jgi:hypothetical protein
MSADGPVEEARDLLVEHLRRHAPHCTAPPGRCPEVAGILGYLAHCLGATRGDLARLPAVLLRYDLECEGGDDHIHRRERRDESGEPESS